MLRKYMLLLLTLIAWSASQAQEVYPTKGKEFWVGFLENFAPAWDEDELSVFITSDQSTSGTLSIPGQGYTENFIVNANQTTQVIIPNNIAEHYTNQVIEQKGIYIETADTVSVFAINFEDHTADGTKVLPIQSLGTEYRISAYRGLSSYGSEFVIVATEDGSEVEIIPSTATAGGNAAGVPFVVQLNAGESYQVQASGASGDFMGTVIQGTEANGDCRPFAVFSGSGCPKIPNNCTACDHIYDQNFPVGTWGTDFYVVPWSFASRYTYRILADVDGTSITIDGGAPFTLNAGEWEEYNAEDEPHCISASAGISVTQYMEGVTCAGSGDPAMCILNDENQKIDNITFATVNSSVITEHGLNIIMSTSDVGTLTLDGATVSAAEFTPFASCPGHSYAQLDISEGSHTLDAPNGFTAYAYGTGNAESYAYSVGSFTPAPPLIVDEVICSSDTINIAEETGLLDVYWYAETFPDDTLATGSQLTLIPPVVSDIYVAVGNHFQSGCVDEQYFSVEVPTPPELSMYQADESVCEFQSTQIGVDVTPTSGAYTYTWVPATGLDDPNIPNPVATPLQPTTYSVLVSTATGCGSNIDSLFIDVLDGGITTFDATASILEFCSNEESQFNLDIQQSIFEDDFDSLDPALWSEINLGTEDVGCGSNNGSALWFNGNGVRSAETIDMDVLNGGTINFSLLIGAGAFPCDNADIGEDVVLEYSLNGAAGPWVEIELFNEADYPSFTALSIDIPPAAESAATRFRWRQLANSGMDQDNWALDDIYIGQSAVSNYTFEWSPNYQLTGIDIADPIASPLIDTTYYVTMTDPMTGCVYHDSLTVDVGQGFNLTMTPDTAICDVAGIVLQAIPDIDGDYEWTWAGDGLNNPWIDSPTATPVSTTTYTVSVNSVQGCVSEGEVTINVNQLSSINASVSQSQICAGESVDLSVDVGGLDEIEIIWSPAETLDDASIENPTASPIDNITYEVTVIDTATACVLTDEVSLEVFEQPQVDLGPDAILCTGETLMLDAGNPGADYDWSTFESTQTIEVSESGEYSVTVTNGLDCETEDIIMVTFNDSPVIGIPEEVTICEDESYVIDAGNAGGTFLWSTSETTQEITVEDAGVYTVTVTTEYGCVGEDELNLIEVFYPEVDLGEDQEFCDGESFVLDAGNPDLNHEWSTAESSQAITVSSTDTYSVVVDNGYCYTEDEVEIIFHELPLIDLPDEHTMCEDETLTLDVENPNSTYLWSTDETTSSISVNLEGSYSVIVTNEYNCVSEGEVDLFIETYPEVDLGPDTELCDGESYQLNAGNGGLNILWSTDQTSPSITVNTTDLYEVSVDNGYCFTTDEVLVTFHANPVLDLPVDHTMCEDEMLLLDAGNPGSTYVWSTDESTQSISVNQEGLYTVVVTNEHDCTSQDQTFLFVETYPVVDLGDDLQQCVGDVVTLDAGNPGLNYNWSTTEISQTIEVSSTGTYAVTVDNDYCFTTDDISILFNPLPVNALFSDSLFCFTEPPYGVLLDAGNSGSTYLWNTGADDQVIEATTEGLYSVQVITAFGCTGFFDAFIHEVCYGDNLYVPNSFTPNNDGINDVFMAVGDNVTEFKLEVWDRWGDKLWETENINEYWIGNKDGGEYYVQSDVYVYVLRYKYLTNVEGEESEWVEKTGHVVLIR